MPKLEPKGDKVSKLKETYLMPNVPSFDFDPKTGIPNIKPGELILVAKMKEGVPVYVTTEGRTIYVCDLKTYEDKFRALVKRNVFEHYFPHVTRKIAKQQLMAIDGQTEADGTVITENPETKPSAD